MERQDEVVRGAKHYGREFVSDNHGDTTDWYRISKRFIRRNGKKVPYVPLEKRDLKHEWEFIRLRPNDKRVVSGQVGEGGLILDEELIRKLESQFDREEEQRVEAAQKFALAIEESRNPSPPAEKQKAPDKSPASSGDEIKRDKHGIKLWSYGGNYNLSVCVNNATKYPGNYSVSLLVAGRRLTYTFGKKEMRALAREVARAFSAKELRELL